MLRVILPTKASGHGCRSGSAAFEQVIGPQQIWFLWFPPHANVSCLPYILGPASGMVIALEEICA